MPNEMEYIELSNGKTSRFYKIRHSAGVSVLPSVTTILGQEEKYYITNWKKAEKNYEKIILYATTVGTLAHFKIQSMIAKKWGMPVHQLEMSNEQRVAMREWYEKFPYSDKETGIFEAIGKITMLFHDWCEEYNPKPPKRLVGEKRKQANVYPFEVNVWSNKFGYAGSMDMLCSIDNQNFEVDFKTNNEINYYLQLTAYYMAFGEMYADVPIDRMAVLNFPKNNKNSVFKFTEYTPECQEWLNNVEKFYKKFGEEYPLSNHRKRVLKNISNYVEE